jgi:hypothetical protein
MVMALPFSLMRRICKLTECGKPFDPIVPHQVFCSGRCATRLRVRKWKAKHRKGGGGPSGGGNGGGGGLTLFDQLPLDSKLRKLGRESAAEKAAAVGARKDSPRGLRGGGAA